MAKIKLAADFSDFLKLCLRNEVRFMVIGGYAVIHHSRPRFHEKDCQPAIEIYFASFS